MPTSFATAILRPDCHLRFYLYVEGLPFVFLDGSAPVGPTGAAWSAPTSKTYAYTLRENMLDVSGGIRDNGPDISRRTAQTRASRMTITLQEDRAGNLLSLMARRKSTGKTAQLAADFGFATGGGPTTMTVDDNSAWASSGYLYFGRETIRYGAKPSATSFGTLTRDVFQLDDGGSTYGDGRYVHNENVATPGGFSVVSDYPRVWHGRWVSLRAFVVDADGRAYDTAFDGTASREIWRGTVNGNPQPKADWERWDLRCRSIEGLLNATDIGSQTVGGSLLRYPGGHKANTEGFTDVDASGEPIINSTSSAYVYFLDDSTRFLDVKIDEYTSQANYDAGTKSATYDLTGESRIEVSATSGVFTRLGLGNTLDLNVNAALTTAGVTNLYMEVHYTGEAQFPTLRPRSTTYVHVLHFDFGVVGSVGKLLGLEGALTHVSKGVGASVPGPAEQLAAYIHPKALTIPVWFAETEGYSPATGGLPDAVPAAGFARIGEEEIVHYSSITDLSDDYVQGLFQLNVSKRGALGTKPQEHRVPSVLMTFATDVDVVKVEFGAGFSDTDPLTALLQLCVSTGESGHHTSYDALGFGVGPQMNPSHFDRDQWASMAAQLSPTFQALSYFISKSVKLSDLVESWLSPLGMFLYAGSTDDDDFRIRVGQVVPALESATEDDIDSSVIARNESAVWLDSITKISNQLVVHYGWDTLTEEESGRHDHRQRVGLSARVRRQGPPHLETARIQPRRGVGPAARRRVGLPDVCPVRSPLRPVQGVRRAHRLGAQARRRGQPDAAGGAHDRRQPRVHRPGSRRADGGAHVPQRDDGTARRGRRGHRHPRGRHGPLLDVQPVGPHHQQVRR